MKWLRNIVCFPICLYQWTLSPLKTALMGPNAGCRFQPTCSNYAIQAIQEHGICTGGMISLKRILRCHPWGGQGWDPVPPSDQEVSNQSSKKRETKRQKHDLNHWTPAA